MYILSSAPFLSVRSELPSEEFLLLEVNAEAGLVLNAVGNHFIKM